MFTINRPNDQRFMDEGLCAQTDPESFFPEKGGSTRAARSVCSSCPVLDVCRDWVLSNPQEFGVWGGMTRQERERLGRQAA